MMIEDLGLREDEAILKEYILSQGYELRNGPFNTSMGIDENGAFYNLPESIVTATATDANGKIIGFRLLPYQREIYQGTELVKKLEDE